jgi:hypothetical protein
MSKPRRNRRKPQPKRSEFIGFRVDERLFSELNKLAAINDSDVSKEARSAIRDRVTRFRGLIDSRMAAAHA